MLKLRKFLASSFGTISLIASFTSAGIVFPLLLNPPHHFNSFHVAHGVTAFLRLWSMVLSGLLLLLLIMPAVLACLYGMASWTLKRGRPSARRWALAASTAMLAQSLPLVAAIAYVVRYVHDPRLWLELSILPAVAVVLAVLGLVAFGPRNSTAQLARPATPPRIPGDGTSGLLDTIASVLGAAAYFLSMWRWHAWGAAHHLHHYGGILQIVVGLLVTIALHELGHAAAGVALGMKLYSFVLGPFQWRIQDGKWTFKFSHTDLLSASGAVSLVPTNPRQSRWAEIGMTAAGPVASLLTGLVALGLAVTAPGRAYEGAWGLFAMIATMGLIAFVINLVPLRPTGLYSDGAQIYQLLRGGRWAEFHRVISLVTSSLVTPLRPRDFDIEAILRSAEWFTQGSQGVLLRLYAADCYLDRGDLAAAAGAIAEADAAYERSPWKIPAGLCAVFAFRIAFLQHDLARARVWWDRVQANQPRTNVDYWLAKTALLWAENRPGEAQEALQQASTAAMQLPAGGAYEFDRHLCSLLAEARAEVAARA